MRLAVCSGIHADHMHKLSKQAVELFKLKVVVYKVTTKRTLV